MSQTSREERQEELTRMTRQQLIDMCRTGIRRPDGRHEVLEGDLEKWRKPELVDAVLSVEYPESPVLAGLTPVGEEDPRETWKAIRDRSGSPGFAQSLAGLAATSEGLAALERARWAWTSRGLEVPWPVIVEASLSDAGLPGGPGTSPPGTRASRCTVCGETRVSYPDVPLDEWKHHFDYCGTTEGNE